MCGLSLFTEQHRGLGGGGWGGEFKKKITKYDIREEEG